ncbi:hypothetical protein BU25DRAFT_441136 [Macroventuria anomochaeta]|uniref:Uncharacterized protein n=1 Tax=Macroventuria anomochaeta TaxID=301207 RepID=A0ACB6RY10_9PLEO|nr:uncharacterized protein BU25DRAFT_441136 [Macroventuria anomochaeta]KAF2626033.1 hypothetical protein BU25DRAFT_441136 [Macroventuria anomochaeta]
MPSITLWFLQTSRSIQTARLLEELGLDYEEPEDFKLGSGNPLGKFPTVKDGDLVGAQEKIKVLQWVHAAEATFVEAAEKGMSVNVQNDMSWLESELSLSPGEFLIGDYPTDADIMVHFSAKFTIARDLGTNGKQWPNIDQWLKACEDTEGQLEPQSRTQHTGKINRDRTTK